MRIAIVGPTHPYKGGIAQHATELARRLSAASHDVTIVSWRRQYPFFYPGAMFVPDGQPEVPTFANTKRVLSWKRPSGWLGWGRKLRGFDQVILIWWVPTIQGPVYASMLRALGKKGPETTVLCHNVLPHEPRPGDRRLARAVFKRTDQVIVHSPAQAKLASELGARQVEQLELPLAIPAKWEARQARSGLSHDLLFFGIIRPYKGVDVLIRALAKVPDVKLTIAGEFWGDNQSYRQLIEELGLADRVIIKPGYVPANQLHDMIGQADAVVLPYRHGTGSWNVHLAHAYGVPVIATTAGWLARQVNDGVDGLLCEPDNVESLATAIKRFYQPGVAEKLRKGVPEPRTDEIWQNYVAGVTKS